MRNIIILCTILLVVIAILAARYFTALAGKDDNITKVLSYIPADAALVLQFDNDESFYEIFKDYPVFDEIIGKSRKAEISNLKKLLGQPALSELTSDKKIFLSFHPSQDSVEFLFSMNIDRDYSADDLKEAISEGANILIKPLYNKVYTLQSDELEKLVYVFLEPGTAIASFSEILIKRCINKEEAHLSNEFIEEINKTSSRNQNSPVNLFVNHQTMLPFLMHFFAGKANGNLALLSNLKGISSLSMNFKSDALMFNGISTTDTLTPGYLNIFLHQKSVPNTIKKILPENTSNFLAFGLSDVNRFHHDLKLYFEKGGELQKLENQRQLIQSGSGVDIDRDIKPLLDKEFASIENSYGEEFAIIKVRNGRDMNFKLQLLSRPINETISQLNYNHIFHYYFGEPLKKFPRPYFAVADNNLIIANTPGIITNFLIGYQNERFLSNTENFKKYDQLVANRSNILFFVNIKRAGRLVRSNLKPRYARAFAAEESGLKNFYGLSYQWSSEGDHFFSNFYLSHNSSDSIALNR